jgi:hypothetical protein
MTFAEVQRKRAELMPQLERLLVSLAYWRRHNKLKTNYTHQDPRGGQSSVVPFPAAGSGAVKHYS